MSKPEVEIKVSLPGGLAESAQQIAEDNGVTLDAVIRAALRNLVERETGQVQAPKAKERVPRLKKKYRAPQVDLEKIATRMKRAVEVSSTWDELQHELRKDGLEVAPKGGGISIVRADTKTDVCKASQVGYAYAKLIKEFQAGMPGHSHDWLVKKVLGEAVDDEPLIEDEPVPWRP